MPSLIPITHLAYPSLTCPLATLSLFSIVQSLLWFVSLLLSCFIFLSLHLCSSVLLNSTYDRNHTVLVFLWLTLLSVIHSSSIHIIANGDMSFFWWLRNIALYIHTHIYVHTYTQHIFTHSSVHGHLGLNMFLNIYFKYSLINIFLWPSDFPSLCSNSLISSYYSNLLFQYTSISPSMTYS